jgi:hypothetical protein
MGSIALLALVVAMFAAGCGGGSGKTATTQATAGPTQRPLTKAGYVALGDTICTNHESRRQDLESQANELGPLDSPAKAREIATLLRKESRNLTAEVEELEGLDPPAGEAARVDEILAALRTRATAIRRWASAYYDLDQGRIHTLQVRLGVVSGHAARRARSYGFRACGQ